MMTLAFLASTYKKLSYRRKIVLQCALVLAKVAKMGLEDDILRT